MYTRASLNNSKSSYIICMVKVKTVKINQFFEKIIKKQSTLAQLNELKNAYEAFFTAFNNYTTDFFEKRLNESKKEDLKDMNICLVRVTNAFLGLSQTIDSGGNLTVDDSNGNLVDIVGITSNVLVRYNQLNEKDDLFVDIFSDFTAALKVLNDDIIFMYNATHEQRVYTIQEAYAVYKQNSPKEIDDLL